MAAKSRMEKYRLEIENLMKIGVSIRSAWRLINVNLPKEGKISYNAFYHFIKKNKINL
ncbi:hypothetical protein ACIB15232_1198 [Aliarcobacter cibarius]|uniref:hypothetical protein n=1 Tax=Aliarcobacter cibarius TaxID=255507 RepID=UPI0012A18A4B|nr:hypothetical protein [Aliarcobacter cibarius]QEZ89310.1 hypothetical protein ACIB15232_1198 [Aliarcobacter cibarius]